MTLSTLVILCEAKTSRSEVSAQSTAPYPTQQTEPASIKRVLR